MNKLVFGLLGAAYIVNTALLHQQTNRQDSFFSRSFLITLFLVAPSSSFLLLSCTVYLVQNHFFHRYLEQAEAGSRSGKQYTTFRHHRWKRMRNWQKHSQLTDTLVSQMPYQWMDQGTDQRMNHWTDQWMDTRIDALNSAFIQSFFLCVTSLSYFYLLTEVNKNLICILWYDLRCRFWHRSKQYKSLICKR